MHHRCATIAFFPGGKFAPIIATIRHQTNYYHQDDYVFYTDRTTPRQGAAQLPLSFFIQTSLPVRVDLQVCLHLHEIRVKFRGVGRGACRASNGNTSNRLLRGNTASLASARASKIAVSRPQAGCHLSLRYKNRGTLPLAGGVGIGPAMGAEGVGTQVEPENFTDRRQSLQKPAHRLGYIQQLSVRSVWHPIVVHMDAHILPDRSQRRYVAGRRAMLPIFILVTIHIRGSAVRLAYRPGLLKRR